jgi:acetylornithine/succinyldiaminopimelate/putrescine aminotransferase
MPECSLSQISPDDTLRVLAGPLGESACEAMADAKVFLDGHKEEELLRLVGVQVNNLSMSRCINKSVMQKSWGGGTESSTDDLLAGRGLFYISEQGQVFLDCTAGHYQMTWGYQHPVLTRTVIEGMHAGVLPDNHSNIPQWPVKRLAQKLVEVANFDMPELREGDFSAVAKSNSRLNTVLLGIATGSVACSSALKIMLMHYQRTEKPGPAVIVVMKGNYHGTDFLAQNLRGMWGNYLRNLKVCTIEPNDCTGLKKVFSRYGERIAGFWAEPILMNNEAILLSREFMRTARKLTREQGALMVLDEIQTGFWVPEVFMYKQYGITPDILVIGKGMTAGFHPLSAILYRRPLDLLAQYDAISTNGNAALASLTALASINLLEKSADRIKTVGNYYGARLEDLRARFPHRIAAVNGYGLLRGLKFHNRNDAVSFHTKCLESGLWLRLHVYHNGHSTILTKFALNVTTRIIDFFAAKVANLLERT